MPIVALGYMGIRSQRLADWSDYACRLLGMQKVDSGGGSMAFRMDHWRQRLVVIDEGGDEFAVMGWQGADSSERDGLAARIEGSGIAGAEAGRHTVFLAANPEPFGGGCGAPGSPVAVF